MKQWTVRLGLSLMVGIGWWTTRLPAQTPVTTRTRIALVQEVVPAPEPACAATAAGLAADARKQGALRTFWRMANDRDCFATHNSVGCSSCWGDLMFVFGSCRTFFGEPCAPPPPGTRLFGH